MRQIANEAHCVGKRDRPSRLAQVQLAGRCIQRREELIRCVSARLDQRIEQRRFSGVGVTNQGNVEGIPPLTLAALGLALALYLAQPFFGALDGLTNHPTVELNLRFPRATPRADAAALPLQV